MRSSEGFDRHNLPRLHREHWGSMGRVEVDALVGMVCPAYAESAGMRREGQSRTARW